MSSEGSEYKIRVCEVADGPSLDRLRLAAITRIGPRSYTAEQIEVWANRARASKIAERISRGDSAWIAEAEDGSLAAYVLVESPVNGSLHLDHLYAHPDHTRRGLADDLLSHLEKWAHRQSVTRIYTEASDLARPVFARSGYDEKHRRDFDFDGVAIHNWAMEKRL